MKESSTSKSSVASESAKPIPLGKSPGSKVQRRALPSDSVVADLLKLSIIREALDRLDRELPQDLCFHNAQHSIEVLQDAVHLASLDNLTLHEIELIAIAAAYHDLGFIKRRNANEPIAAGIARKAMLRAGYKDADIRLVEQAILDTRLRPYARAKTLRQRATGKLSAHLLDADLGNLGTDGFLMKSLLLFREYTGATILTTVDLKLAGVREFLDGTYRLMRHHKFHSPAGQKLFTEQKTRNIERLARLISSLKRDDAAAIDAAWNDLSHP